MTGDRGQAHERVERALAALDRVRGSRVSQLSSRHLAREIEALEAALAADAGDALARMRAVAAAADELRSELDAAVETLEALGRRSAVGTP